MAEYDRVAHLQLFQNCRSVVAKNPRGIVDRRFARFSGAAIIMDDHQMVFRELGNLITLPNLPVAGGLAKKDEWPSPSVRFIKDFSVAELDNRHEIYALVSDELTDQSMSFVRIGKEVAMALVGQHHELGIGNASGQNLRG